MTTKFNAFQLGATVGREEGKSLRSLLALTLPQHAALKTDDAEIVNANRVLFIAGRMTTDDEHPITRERALKVIDKKREERSEKDSACFERAKSKYSYYVIRTKITQRSTAAKLSPQAKRADRAASLCRNSKTLEQALEAVKLAWQKLHAE